MTHNASSARSSFCSWLLKPESTATAENAAQASREKMAAIRQDPFAMELALRLATAEVSTTIGESFQSCYKLPGKRPQEIGELWLHLTIICLEDKTFGQGRPGSIVDHPTLDAFPTLRDIGKARTDPSIVSVARRFQAAFNTMNSFEKPGPMSGVQSFDKRLREIGEPDDLWIVLSGLRSQIEIVIEKSGGAKE